MGRCAVAAASLVLAMTPAHAEETTLRVTATILPRNTCALDRRLVELRCAGRDATVPYRVIRESDTGETSPSAPAAALRDRSHRIAVGGNRTVTIEF